jgi:hypothetical protein
MRPGKKRIGKRFAVAMTLVITLGAGLGALWVVNGGLHAQSLDVLWTYSPGH